METAYDTLKERQEFIQKNVNYVVLQEADTSELIDVFDLKMHSVQETLSRFPKFYNCFEVIQEELNCGKFILYCKNVR